jgi:predicted neutral ceramidase superfamily lipid hydrolase
MTSSKYGLGKSTFVAPQVAIVGGKTCNILQSKVRQFVRKCCPFYRTFIHTVLNTLLQWLLKSTFTAQQVIKRATCLIFQCYVVLRRTSLKQISPVLPQRYSYSMQHVAATCAALKNWVNIG